MTSNSRDNMVKPDWMDDEQWAFFKDATSSLERIRGDSKADIEKYLESPEDWVKAETSPSGFPTLLLTMIVLPVFCYSPWIYLLFKHGRERLVVVVSLIGALANLAITCALLPRLGILGALIGAASSQWLILLLYWRQRMGPEDDEDGRLPAPS